MANSWIKLFLQVLVIALISNSSYAKTVAKGIEKLKVKIEDDTDVVCLNAERPYGLLSRKDKKRLEYLLNSKETKNDPNLYLP